MSRLDPLARAVLLALNVCSEVSSSGKWMREDAAPAAAGDPAREPAGVGLKLRDLHPAAWFAWRYQGCRTDEQRRAVLADALDELRALKHGRRLKIDVETREGRLAVGRDQREVWLVAYTYGYSERHVRRLRAEAAEFDRKVA